MNSNEVKYPDVTVNLVGNDGNAFAIIGAVSRALKMAGKDEAAKEFQDAAFLCGTYHNLLRLAMETVNVK